MGDETLLARMVDSAGQALEQLTSLLALLAALSLATERITELIKGLPVVSRWLAIERARGSTAEEFRKASIHLLAIAVGTFLARLIQDQLSTAVSVSGGGFWMSGLWNSALDIVREVNKQKQILPGLPSFPMGMDHLLARGNEGKRTWSDCCAR